MHQFPCCPRSWSLALAVSIAAASGMGAAVIAAPPRASGPPNVVLIMADDLGYGDLSCYGHDRIDTPRLDKLAAGGMRLTSFYTGASVCTPSRWALLTGAYPKRLGWTGGVDGYLMPKRSGLNPEALTIAEVFQSAGYATGISGKWHLGTEPPFRPHRQGFEFTYYIPRSNNQVDYLMSGDEVIEKPFDNRLLTEQFTNQAIDFIKQHKDQPFFLYIPYTAPHFPVQAHPDWQGKSDLKHAYGDVIEEVDHRIGQIVDALKKQRLDQNTIIVFLSDNGPQKGDPGRAGPYRGLKWTALEGGQRVPCIVYHPGVVPAGKVSDAMVAAIDLLPTLAEACGLELNSISRGSPRIDGVSAWDLLRGKSAPSPRNELLLWHGRGASHAIRLGTWKLIVDPQDKEGLVLYNLAEDPAEKHNVRDRHPARVEQMNQLAEQRLQEIEEHRLELGVATDP